MAIQTNRHDGPQADRATAQPHSRGSSHDGDITRHHGLATTRQHSGDRMIPVMRVTHADVDRLARLDHLPGRRPLVASRNTPRLTRSSSARPASRGRTSRGMTRPTTIRRPRSSTICSLGGAPGQWFEHATAATTGHRACVRPQGRSDASTPCREQQRGGFHAANAVLPPCRCMQPPARPADGASPSSSPAHHFPQLRHQIVGHRAMLRQGRVGILRIAGVVARGDLLHARIVQDTHRGGDVVNQGLLLRAG